MNTLWIYGEFTINIWGGWVQSLDMIHLMANGFCDFWFGRYVVTMANGDVWDEIEDIMSSRPGKVEFQKVESHLEEGDLDDRCARTKAAKSGNDMADEIAGHAAKQSAVDEGTARSVYMWIARAKVIQDRIFEIEQHLAKLEQAPGPSL